MGLNETVTYPMQGDGWVKTVLVGGVLVFFGVLLVPLFLVYGYAIRTIRGSLSGESTPPTFGDWGELLVDGVQAWIISFVYLLVPLVVAGVAVGGALAAIATGSETAAAVGTGGLLFGFAISAILALLFGYLAAVALVNFAREDRFGAAFDAGVIRTVALDREYAFAWLLSVGVFIAASLVSAVPLVGWVLAPFASFYAVVVAANLWAGGFERALGPTADVTRPSDDEAAV